MSKAVSKVREAKLELYRKKGTIHAKAVGGRFNTARWAMVWLTQIVFYGACWLPWATEDGIRQAILFDIVHEKLYLFGLVLWPQDALLLAFALILAATALFFVTAMAGRLFCGFACPQTVYTSIFVWIEARIEGDHLARLKLDQSSMSARKLAIKSAKHGAWALVAGWTAITFVGYFSPIRELLPAVAALQTGPWESFWLIFYAVFTYVQAGLAREAVCQHMCPYSRFQGVMIDAATANVSYDRRRGEPRGARRRADAGDCIDCGICVQVCPTGIDIRDGLQYQCINCGLCVDGCDEVMDKLGAPRGLIRFASDNTLAGAPEGTGPGLRPRVLVYASLLLLFSALSVWTLSQRATLRVDVLRDRGALSRETAEGRIENDYTLKLINMEEAARRFRVDVHGLPGLRIEGDAEFTIGPGSIQTVPVVVSSPAEAAPAGARPIEFHTAAVHGAGAAISEKSSFILP
ncbi:cytochrome c oxidase accessory protein CcoG [Thauera linaloolentis]|uniref:Cytochrome C oxidase accessory protein CcoG n=1 Tax=Thauera linaloolentis (strain DSM 12138 / JCM 21573 / CCUG 41526 / CIP 105981 / IAM 15112 / NBRC 102519 / 47Lol) TaxID=1123367 RepID=N6YY03_THAL4|nr:cytochrome c oxidase accessory protein CcoG [Thauera linaloolentis]ENO87023.1 cytochrome C oxidase accessory protein CcoG [Thauera linaloolentis 47Lol = DSM 12138]MCM8565803.1 cytochrome c oxidase accessory protein CcoG [Thauera linaloolentis]